VISLFISCQTDEMPQSTGAISFSLLNKIREENRTTGVVTPAFVLLSVKNEAGVMVLENKKLPLFSFGQSYVSENIELPVGNYKLTQFVVLDAANKAIYATPIEGSELAKYVEDPLPISFTVFENKTSLVVPQVLEIEPNDMPENFGYVSFGFEIFTINTIKKTETRDVNGLLLNYTIYVYNPVNKLIGIKSYLNIDGQFSLTNNISLEYKNNLLWKVSREQGNSISGEYIYFYVDGKLDKVDVYSNGSLFGSKLFSYSNNKVKITQPLVGKELDLSKNYVVYDVIDGNISKYTKVENGIVTNCYSYTYFTTHFNPYGDFEPLFFRAFPYDNSDDLFSVVNSKNLIKEKYNCSTSSPLVENNFQINEDGFPIQLKSSSSPTGVYTSFYY
jgi:hypothetical protein